MLEPDLLEPAARLLVGQPDEFGDRHEAPGLESDFLPA